MVSANHALSNSAQAAIRGIFAQFMTMREKQILARAIEIYKENWG